MKVYLCPVVCPSFQELTMKFFLLVVKLSQYFINDKTDEYKDVLKYFNTIYGSSQDTEV